MEKVESCEQSVEVFENDIVLYLKMFCEEQNIKDLKKESQSVWNGCLRYIKKHVFNDKSKLKSKSNINIYNNNIPSNFNAYNYDIVNDICDIYIDLCFIYDKEVSIMGFSNLTGIDNSVIREWGYNNKKLSESSLTINKKLTDYREESLMNKLATGKQNPIGVLSILNKFYGFNMPGVKEQNNKQVLTAEELPKLGNISNNNDLIDMNE